MYSETLENEGFVINPYDKCVANKEIDGKQCTIVWYVDDNKVSHVDPLVVTDVINTMKSHFGELTVTRGKKHRFLGMNITINEDKNIEIEMKDQLQEAVDQFEQADGSQIHETVTSDNISIYIYICIGVYCQHHTIYDQPSSTMWGRWGGCLFDPFYLFTSYRYSFTTY